MKYTGNTPFGLRQTDHNSSGIFSAGVERITIDSNGNVGIGTTSPTQALHVDGKLRLDGSIYNGNPTYLEFDPNASDSLISQKGGGNFLILRGNNGVKLQRNSGNNVTVVLGEDAQRIVADGSADSMSLFTAGTEKVRINSNGNIGIGTTVPLRPLHVSLSTNDEVARFTSTQSNDAYIEINSNTSVGIPKLGVVTNDFVFVPDGSNETVRFTSDGNVGIGTTSPSEKLHVAGNIKLLDKLSFTEHSANDYLLAESYGLIVSGDQSVSFKVGGTTSLNVYATQVRPQSNNTVDLGHTAFGWKTVRAAGNITTSSGAIGIGTQYPQYALHVEKDSTNTSMLTRITNTNAGGRAGITFALPNNNNQMYSIGVDSDRSFKIGENTLGSNTRFVITAVGNVGIGTTSPSQKLDVAGNVKAAKLLLNTANSGYTLYSNGESRINGVIFQQSSGTEYLQKASGTGDFYVRNSVSGQRILVGANNSSSQFTNFIEFDGANNDATIRTNDVDRLYINSSGNVGIGTTSPTAKLDIGPGAGGAETVVMVAGTGNGNLKARHIEGKLYNSTADGILHLNYYSSEDVSIAAGGGNITTGAGNVGIGTTTPSEKLEVVGDIASQGIYVDRTHESDGVDEPFAKLGLHHFHGDANFLTLQKSGQTSSISFGVQYGSIFATHANGMIRLQPDIQTIQVAQNALNLGVIQHSAANNNFGQYLAVTNGINSTGVRGRVDINGDLIINDYSTSSLVEKAKIGNDGSAYFSGNVGIGTTSPETELHVNGTLRVHRPDGSNYIDTYVNGANYSIIESKYNGLDIKTLAGAATPHIRLLPGTGGNVGIGRTSPGYKLDVSGSGNFTDGLTVTGSILHDGDLTVTGIITAQEFRTEYISQTIIFESGSTTFGDDADDVHTRNGSVIINKNHTGVLTGNKVDALTINNNSMGSTGPETRIKFQANSNPTATISTKVDGSGIGGGLSFEVAENPTTLTTRLRIDKSGSIGISAEPVASSLLKLGLRNLNGDGILLENTTNSNEVAKLYQDNGTEGILSLSNSGLEHVKIRSNGASFFDGGTVGFGTQNPSSSHKVDIVGDLKVGGTGVGTGNYLEIVGFNQSNTVILRQFDSNSGLHSFRFQTALNGLFTFNNGGSNELVRFDSQRNYFANNVGIGTLSAATTLDIVDEFPVIRLEDPVAGASSLLSGDGGNITLSADQGNQDGGSHIAFRVDNSEKARITSAGNLGIGTSSPSYPLDVNGAVRAGSYRIGGGTVLSGLSTVYLGSGGATGAIGLVTTSGQGLTLDGANVGIGTTSPLHKLDVSGTVRLKNSASELVIDNSTYSEMRYGPDNYFRADGSQATVNGPVLRFRIAGTEKMRVHSNGNVGIGTVSPSDKLTVQDGSITSTDASGVNYAKIDRFTGLTLKGNGAGSRGIQTPNTDALTFGTNATERMRITSGGNVGIGTTSPSEKLHVDGTILVNNEIHFVTNQMRIYRSSNDMRLRTASTDRMTITSSGNVGIGTTSPNQKLTVNGNIRATGSTARLILDNTSGAQSFQIYTWAQGTNIYNSSAANANIYFGRDASVANNFYFSRNGNDHTMKVDTANERVGIGTTAPTEALHVSGVVAVGDTATVKQTARQFDGAPAGTRMETFDGNTYIGAFIDYTVYDDSRDHMRSGTIQMVFNATGEARFTDNSTTDIGNTSQAYFQVVSAAPNTEIKFVAPDPTWHVRYHVRYL